MIQFPYNLYIINNSNFMNTKILSISLALITSIFLYSCSSSKEYIISGNIFGTIYQIQIESEEKIDIIRIKSNIENILTNIDSSASNYIKNSEVSVFNNTQSTKFIKVSSNLYNIIEKSLYVSNLTNGYFDITTENLKIQSGFYDNFISHKINSNTKEIVNFNHIILNKNLTAIKKNNANIKIDMSGVAKGYAVDAVYNYLIDKNVSRFLINIGGEIKTYSNNDVWVVGIEDFTKNNQYIEEISLNNFSIASSGTYKDIINKNGTNISHIVNPITGKYITNLNILVSVIHKECALADAIATGLIAMNIQDIIDFSNKKAIASMLVIKEKDDVKKYYSDEFKKYLKNN